MEPMTTEDYRALAQIRFLLRGFLKRTEERARSNGVTPQQHQLMLAVAGRSEGQRPTVGSIATQLHIRHNTAVELVDRTLQEDLIRADRGSEDRREVLLSLTDRGREILERISMGNREEWRKTAPELQAALDVVVPELRSSHNHRRRAGSRQSEKEA